MEGNLIRHCSRRLAGPAGFTLIELLIAIVIVGILAAIALPSYSNQLIKGRRAAAQAHLMDIAQRQQQYLIDTRTYAPSIAALSMTEPADVTAHYTIRIDLSATLPPGFTITATPKAGGAQASDAVLTLDNRGAKTPDKLW